MSVFSSSFQNRDPSLRAFTWKQSLLLHPVSFDYRKVSLYPTTPSCACLFSGSSVYKYTYLHVYARTWQHIYDLCFKLRSYPAWVLFFFLPFHVVICYSLYTQKIFHIWYNCLCWDKGPQLPSNNALVYKVSQWLFCPPCCILEFLFTSASVLYIIVPAI